LYIRQIFHIQMKYHLQNMNNHMVGRAASVVSPFYSILLNFSQFRCLHSNPNFCIRARLKKIIRVTHKGWDCKDDRNLLKCDDSMFSALDIVISWVIPWFGNETHNFTCAENCENSQSINSVQSSLKSHPLWVTLYNAYL